MISPSRPLATLVGGGSGLKPRIWKVLSTVARLNPCYNPLDHVRHLAIALRSTVVPRHLIQFAPEIATSRRS